MEEINIQMQFCETPDHPRFMDLTGQTFHWLTVIGFAARPSKWYCQCRCGKIKIVEAGKLKSGTTKSCGCYRAKGHTLHGHTSRHAVSSEYNSYNSAKKRCTNPKTNSYHNYGGRGIEFRFKSFQEFFDEVGRKPTPAHTIDRINNNGHYEPGNVRWATRSEQRNNTRRGRKPA